AGYRKGACLASSNPSFSAIKKDCALAQFFFYPLRQTFEPERRRRGLAHRSAACGGYSEVRLAPRSVIGKAAAPPQTEPGTARGLVWQVQIPLSPP
ncbi:MAG: hypothetical protein ACLRVT_06375, partial [Oscillospiraceae bacterium]